MNSTLLNASNILLEGTYYISGLLICIIPCCWPNTDNCIIDVDFLCFVGYDMGATANGSEFTTILPMELSNTTVPNVPIEPPLDKCNYYIKRDTPTDNQTIVFFPEVK